MISRLMLNLRDPKILTPSTNRTAATTSESIITKTYPMMSTVIDPNPSTISYIEEEHIYTQGGIYNGKMTRPIGELIN
jgi:hypothetical protein